MKSYFFDNAISFQDTELKPGWLKGKYKITNDATAAFIGPYINTQEQGDIKKVLQNNDDSMLHIIVEHKGKGGRETATCLELMLVLLCQTLGPDFWSSKHRIYYENACLGLSAIETRFRSSIFHLALFIEPDIPKKNIKGLQDFDVNARDFAILLMQKYCDKIQEIEDHKNKL